MTGIDGAGASRVRELLERIQRYQAWCDSPEFEPCPRCRGRGYHHGFGEHGHDPDWCESCGGPGEQATEPGTWSPDDLLKEAADELAAALPAPIPHEDWWKNIVMKPPRCCQSDMSLTRATDKRARWACLSCGSVDELAREGAAPIPSTEGLTSIRPHAFVPDGNYGTCAACGDWPTGRFHVAKDPQP